MTDKQMQCLLTYLGYNPGAIDGISGKNTQAALERFKVDYGVGADGLPGAVAGMIPKLNKPDSGKDSDVTANESGDIWKESRYFTRQEFRCPCGKCGGFPVEPNEKLVKLVNAIREEIGKPIVIVPPDGHSGGSGIRCADYNKQVGGVANSYHTLGMAADLHIYGVSPSDAAAVAEKMIPGTGGIGIYSWGIHVDVRADKSRWDYR